MRVFIQLTVCISFIILTGGTISYIHQGATFGGGLILVLAWGASIPIMIVTCLQTFELEQAKHQPEKPSSKRMKELSKQLTDIQDIVISLDDQIKRLNRQPAEVEPLEKI